jgi:diguanylate cyclase (GGDEF)-like protein
MANDTHSVGVEEEVPRERWWVLCLGGALLMILLAWADALLGHDIALDDLYFLPVVLAAWRRAAGLSLFLAIFGSVAYFVGEFHTGYAQVHLMQAFWDMGMLTGALVVVSVLLSHLRKSLDREQKLARTDILTGLANRRTFYERVALEIERMRRAPRPLSLAYMDVDDFKEVNDRHGHAAGDEVLRAVADVLRRGLRQMDLAGRIGGDEFVVLLPETGPEGAITCLTDLQRGLEAAMAERKWPVRCSIGAVTFLRPPVSEDDLVRRADALMYGVKHSGKGQLRHAVVEAEEEPLAPEEA